MKGWGEWVCEDRRSLPQFSEVEKASEGTDEGTEIR